MVVLLINISLHYGHATLQREETVQSVIADLEDSGKVSSERELQRDALAQAVANLSRIFTTARATLPLHYLDDPAHASAYLSYFLPVNLSKIQALLDELPEASDPETPDQPMAVLDLGRPRDWSLSPLGLAVHRPEQAKSVSVLRLCFPYTTRDTRKLWDTYCQEVEYPVQSALCRGNLEHPLKGDLGKQIVRGGPYDLIIMANCLNELFPTSVDPPAERAVIVAQLLPFLASHGSIMIVEPALRQTSRALHQVRNRLLKQGLCTVYSPCLHEGACPALDHPDDWCHEERPWQTPLAIVAIDLDAGFIKDALKFSYLLLQGTDGRTIAMRSPKTFRVVSEPRIERRYAGVALQRAGSVGSWATRPGRVCDKCSMGGLSARVDYSSRRHKTEGRINVEKDTSRGDS
jgi:ribosomal protein RSM22 (predicted rRNA methylase)